MKLIKSALYCALSSALASIGITILIILAGAEDAASVTFSKFIVIYATMAFIIWTIFFASIVFIRAIDVSLIIEEYKKYTEEKKNERNNESSEG